MAKGFYLKLAFANIKRSKAIYLPYAIATAIISGVYFLVNMLRYSPGISGVPSGEAAQAVFMFTSVFISLFTFIFMMYINNFLIKRRKKEFGLYGVLGLEKRHVGRVLLYENFFVMAAGVLVGVAPVSYTHLRCLYRGGGRRGGHCRSMGGGSRYSEIGLAVFSDQEVQRRICRLFFVLSLIHI